MAAPGTASRSSPRKERRRARDRSQGRGFRWLLGGLLIALAAALAWRFWFEGTARRVAELDKLAHAARQDRNPQQVIALTRQWCALAPYDATPFVMQAEAHQEQGDLAAAAEVLEQLPDTDPRTPKALLELSHLYFGDVNKPLSGVRTCERVIRLALSGLLPKTEGLAAAAEASRRLVFFYGVTRQRNKLLAECRAAIAGGHDLPETYIYLMIADRVQLTNSPETLRNWASSTEADEAIHVGLVLAELAQSESENPDSIAAVIDPKSPDLSPEQQRYLESRRRYPANLELLNRELRSLVTVGEAAGVVAALQQASVEAAEDSRFWRYRGWLLGDSDQFGPAIAAYRQALEMYPFDHVARSQLAAVLRRSGSLEEVAELERLAEEGKELQRGVLQLPDVRSANELQLQFIAGHLRACGDAYSADCLLARLSRP